MYFIKFGIACASQYHTNLMTGCVTLWLPPVYWMN